MAAGRMARAAMGLLANMLRKYPLLRFLLPLAIVAFLFLAYQGADQARLAVESNPGMCRACHTMEKAWTRWQVSEHRSVTCISCHEANMLETTQLLVVYVLNRPNDVGKHAGISDENCLRCHGNGDPRWAQVAETAGHKVHYYDERVSCTKCHSISLHRFEPPAKVCLSCHGETQITVTSMANRYCIDCHRFLRTQSSLLPERQPCLDCHLRQARAEVHWPASGPMTFACSQCHKPHQAIQAQSTCNSCHGQIRDAALHSVRPHSATPCVACHKPHEWKADTSSCAQCHSRRVAAGHGAGVQCSVCHGFRGVRRSG